MSEGFEGPSPRLLRDEGPRAAGKGRYVLYGNAGSPDISTPALERETRDFMSRNSLGSPTFMFYPVIMMSTYTPDKTKHYLSSFSPFLSLSLSLFLFRFPTFSASSSPFPYPLDLAVVIGIRPRRGNASHFSDEESVRALARTFLSLYFVKAMRQDGHPGMSIDILRTRAGS